MKANDILKGEENKKTKNKRIIANKTELLRNNSV